MVRVRLVMRDGWNLVTDFGEPWRIGLTVKGQTAKNGLSVGDGVVWGKEVVAVLHPDYQDPEPESVPVLPAPDRIRTFFADLSWDEQRMAYKQLYALGHRIS